MNFNVPKPTDKPFQIVFVPEGIYEDLVAVGGDLIDLLQYDKAKSMLSSQALKQFALVNSLSRHGLPQDEDSYLSNIPAFEKLSPLLREALDVRMTWCTQSLSETDLEELSVFTPSDNFAKDSFEVDSVVAFRNVISGIYGAVTQLETSYEWVRASIGGRILFVVLPYTIAESTGVEDTVVIWRDRVIEEIQRKVLIHFSDTELYSSDIFNLYLNLKTAG